MGMAPSFEGWKGMNPAEREAYKKVWAEFMMQTLDLRQELVSNQIALDTLWAQPQVDKNKIQKLADATADLWAELEKKRSKYLTDCRLQFGDLGWTCPITGTGSGSYYK
jgi:Spy/CpxP family protein refolding chaperone